jgi:hypothetical protein
MKPIRSIANFALRGRSRVLKRLRPEIDEAPVEIDSTD